MEYYIYITNNCNMNCAYCSVLFDTEKYGIPLMPNYDFEDLEGFITNTQKKLNDNCADIYFFGGEPTVDYKCILKLIETMEKKHDYKINYIMHTNGLLIPQAPKEVIQKINLTILSFNYELIFKNSQMTEYFGKMVKTIKHIKSISNIPIIGRITVSAKTDLFPECCLIGNFVDYVYWQIDNCAQMQNYEDYKKQYKYNIDLLFDYWIEYLKKGVFLRFVPFISVVKHSIIDIENPTKYYCGYGSSMIYVQTNGKCYACCDNVATDSHYLGDIFSGIKFPDINLEKTVCNGCTYIKLCGGRCGRMHKDFTQERIQQYCELNKYMFDKIINNLSEIKKLIDLYPNYKGVIMDPMISYTEYTS